VISEVNPSELVKCSSDRANVFTAAFNKLTRIYNCYRIKELCIKLVV